MNPRNCIDEANRLQLRKRGRGKVCYIPRIGEQVIGHAYYVPDNTDLDAIALNQADNDFERYPALTIRQVLEYHDQAYLLITAD